MNISRNNYEIYILDYYENSLSPEQVRELIDFLEANPDLKKEFEEFELISIREESAVAFPNRQNLKKNEPLINSGNYRDFMIGFIENNLTSQQADELSKYIQNNISLQKELEAFKKTKLTPDLSVTFPNKNKLKHYRLKPVLPFTLNPVLNTNFIKYAAAASIAVIIGLFILLRSNNHQSNIAVNKNAKPEISVKQIPQNTALQKHVPENKSDLAHVGHKINKRVKHVNQPSPSSELLAERIPSLDKIKPIKSSIIQTENPENIFPEKLDFQKNTESEKLFADNKIKQNQENNKEARNPEENSTLQNAIVSGALAAVGEKSLPTADPKIKRQKINNFWDVAYLATKAYDRVFDKDASLTQKFDGNGNLAYVSYSSGLVDFEKRINNK
jgi:hypothetical protein